MRRLRALPLVVPLLALAQEAGLPDGLYAKITTPRGVIVCSLDYARVPLTVANFVGLAEGTLGPAPRKPFFDGLTFNRVVPKFVIQGGDPLGNGEGGPGYSFPDQFVPGLSHGSVGILSMANDGPDTNGSQFFITLSPVDRLDYLHSVFGRTVQGADVLDKVEQGDKTTVKILRIGADALAFRADDAAFAGLLSKAKKYAFEREPGPTAHFDDPSKLLQTDPPRAKNFTFKLANLERSTGLKIYARVLPSVPADQGATEPQAYVDQLSRSLKIEDSGVLAVYFADRATWFFHVGRDLVGAFTGSAGKASDLESDGTLARSEASLLEDSAKRAKEYTTLGIATLPNFLQIPGVQIKVSVDAVLQLLIEKLVTQKPLAKRGHDESRLDMLRNFLTV